MAAPATVTAVSVGGNMLNENEATITQAEIAKLESWLEGVH